jgi:N,N'-diacetyllegionaminate synthase
MKIPQFFIGDRLVGANSPCLIIAEIGLAHDGSLGAAHAFIDAAAEAGVDAVKFQTHIAASESSPQEHFRIKVFPQDKTRYEYWERTAFTEEQWRSLKEHAENSKLIFLSTPFSSEAVALLRRIGVNAWKIGSGEVNNLLMLEDIALKREPVLLSSGMSYMEELDKSVDLLQSKGSAVMVMQCTSSYPCPPERYGLEMISEYRKHFDVPVGFSDHSGEIAPGLAAVTLGAKALEVHVTWSKQCFGPDVRASLTFDQLKELVRGVRIIEQSLSGKIDKNAVAEEMREMRLLFSKGLVASRPIAAGTLLQRIHLDARKPCTGISVYEYQSVIGKVLKRSLLSGEAIFWKDLD